MEHHEIFVLSEEKFPGKDCLYDDHNLKHKGPYI